MRKNHGHFQTLNLQSASLLSATLPSAMLSSFRRRVLSAPHLAPPLLSHHLPIVDPVVRTSPASGRLFFSFSATRDLLHEVFLISCCISGACCIACIRHVTSCWSCASNLSLCWRCFACCSSVTGNGRFFMTDIPFSPVILSTLLN